MPKNKLFQNVPTARPGRSAFDLSHQVLMTADMGILYPTLVEEVYPGDYFELGTQAIVRMQPMVAPIMHPINIFFRYFLYHIELSIISGRILFQVVRMVSMLFLLLNGNRQLGSMI